MLCAREHIHWLYGLYSISVLRKIFKIPRRRWQDCSSPSRCAGGPWPIRPSAVGSSQPLRGGSRTTILGSRPSAASFCAAVPASAQKNSACSTPIAAALRRALSTASGTISTPISLPAVLRPGKADGTCAAIKVQQRILGAGRGKISSKHRIGGLRLRYSPDRKKADRARRVRRAWYRGARRDRTA